MRGRRARAVWPVAELGHWYPGAGPTPAAGPVEAPSPTGRSRPCRQARQPKAHLFGPKLGRRPGETGPCSPGAKIAIHNHLLYLSSCCCPLNHSTRFRKSTLAHVDGLTTQVAPVAGPAITMPRPPQGSSYVTTRRAACTEVLSRALRTGPGPLTRSTLFLAAAPKAPQLPRKGRFASTAQPFAAVAANWRGRRKRQAGAGPAIATEAAGRERPETTAHLDVVAHMQRNQVREGAMRPR